MSSEVRESHRMSGGKIDELAEAEQKLEVQMYGEVNGAQ